MGGVLDAQAHFAREVTYGTPVAPTRALEALTDPAAAQRDAIQSVGMRAGLNTVRVDRRRNYVKGAEGSLEIHPGNRGFGMLLRAAIGTSAIAQVGTSLAHLQTFETDTAAPNESLTLVMGRPPADPAAAVIPWTYAGGVVHEVTFEQEVDDGDGGQLKATFEMDYQKELTVADGGLALPDPAVYPDADFIYGWPDLNVQVGAVPVGQTRTFSLTLSHGLNRERYYLRNSTLKDRPIRTEVPEYTGSLSFDYVDNTIYDLVRSSEIVPITATWTHNDPNGIDTGETFFLRITMNVQFTGETPQVSLEDLPQQPIEFICLHDGTTPAVMVEYQSDDTDF